MEQEESPRTTEKQTIKPIMGSDMANQNGNNAARVGIVTLRFAMAAYYFWRICSAGIYLIASD